MTKIGKSIFTIFDTSTCYVLFLRKHFTLGNLNTFALLGMGCTLPKVVFMLIGSKSLTCGMGQAV